MVMESINLEIDDAITKVEVVDDEKGPSIKEPIVEVEALDIEVKGLTPEKESTPMNQEWKQDPCLEQQVLSLLWKFILLSLGMMKYPHQRSHHQE